MNSYVTTVAREDRREADARIAERNAEVWEQILNETDQTPGQSFFDAVVKWCGSAGLTRDAYDMLCATCSLPGFEDKQWHRGDLKYYIEKVVEKLRDRNWSDDDIRRKAAELWNKPKPEVRAYLQKLSFTEEVHTLDQARDYLRRHRLLESQRQYFTKDGAGPFPRMPLHTVPPGFVTAVELNARYIHSLEPSEVAKLIRRYSAEQVNDRIFSTKDSLRSSE